MLLHSISPRTGDRITTILAVLLNLYLVVFLADAGVSVLDELGFAATGLHLLAWLRNPLATLAVLGGPGVYLLAVVFRSVPRLFVPIALFPGAVMLMGLPLAYWRGWDNYGTAQISIAQALLGLATLALLWRRSGGRPWLRAGDLPGPVFSFAPALRMVAFTLLLLLPGTLVCFVGLCERCLDHFTGGFVRLQWYGFELVERVYDLDDSRVRLVGMMHIGEQQAYEALVSSFDHPDVLVLAEGIRDEQELLGSGRLHYEAVAARTGLATQRDLQSYRPGIRLRNADVDVSTMSDSTLGYLKVSMRVMGDDGIDLEAVLDLLLHSTETTEADQELFWYDVIDHRNAVLLEHLLVAVTEVPVVVVPWGAAHLPFIEGELLDMGYRRGDERVHPLVTWVGE